MPVFDYRARTSEGELESGQLAAESERVAVALLQERGLYPTSVTACQEAGARPTPSLRLPSARISALVRSAFWRAGAQTQQAGFTVFRTLDLWSAGHHGALTRFASANRGAAEQGEPLSSLMARRPDLFSPLEVGLIRAGEAGGRLDQTMLRLAEHYERELRTRQAVRGPLAYAGCVGVVFFFTAFVVAVVAPTLSANLSGREAHPVAWTLRLLAPFLFVLAAAFAARVFHRGSPSLRLAVDATKLRLPLVGGLFRKMATARFSRSLGELVAAGLNAAEAVEIAAQSTGNLDLTRRLGALPAQLRQGLPLATALESTGAFSPQVIQMVATGEETGATDEMLGKLSDYYDGESAAALSQLTVIGTALLFLVLALAVGWFAINFFVGLYGPILELTE
ncbi:MAG: type II secretion system F family protein [Armatimonadetes bacterium]|nr:type II secretion system F family protein [Armatimonadota bacterium]